MKPPPPRRHLLLAALLALLAAHVAAPSLGAERRLTREYLVRRAQEVAKAISTARGLPLLAPVRADLLTRSELVDLVRRRTNEEPPPEEIRAEGVLLERLGVIDSAADYEQQIYDMFEQQIAGLYDPDDRTLYVLTDLSPDEADLTLWHEIVHTLQDQNFHVGERQDTLEDDGDRSLAYAAVCEGDATLTSSVLQMGIRWDALAWLFPDDVESLRSMFVPTDPDGTGVPTELLEVLSFPYVEGVVFVRQQWEQGGIPAIDDLFRKPPESTEQVIHTEKYGGADSPVRLRFGEPESAFPGRSVRYEDTMGEFVIRVWLGMALSRESAAKAAAGWGGDRIALVVPAVANGAGCASGAVPLDDRLWACGASPTCGADADVRLGEAEGWAVWTTTWDPAGEDHPLGATGEAAEFWDASVAALAEITGPTAAAPQTEQVDEAGRKTWLADGELAVAAARIDGLAVHIVIGPPGRAPDATPLLDDLAAAVQADRTTPQPPDSSNQ
ncbi:MAG: hypothetical protein HY907_10965 [Deltaproteobacteria bacterium]|nr:hypothetical protein [Deltaproteobacteria bacterium]